MIMGKLSKTNGITLIALVVTIVVLIILATISINAVFGENGLIKRAEAAKRLHEQGVIDEQEGLNSLDKYLGDKLNGVPEMIVTPDTPKGPNGKPLVNKDTVNKTEHDKIVGEDKLGNPVVVPNGFKVAEESGETIEEGIIIEDSIGNQFVWVPVSNINGDGVVDNQNADGLITKKDGSKVQITLGRYAFDSTWNIETKIIEGTGNPTLIQKGSEYNVISNEDNLSEQYKIRAYNHGDEYYQYEFSTFRESNYKADFTTTNATAHNLKEFVESVDINKGYYIARYEASFGSGSQPEASKINTAEYITDQKPLSKPSTAHTRSSNTEILTEGMLWNYINQPDASKVSRNMYAGNSYVESDLVNSYMWDTAIVYIQAMENINYAGTTGKSNENLLNTGETGDERCHIFDMAGNLCEWTTEYNTFASDSRVHPFSDRGGIYNARGNYVSGRGNGGPNTDYNNPLITFRPGLYVK